MRINSSLYYVILSLSIVFYIYMVYKLSFTRSKYSGYIVPGVLGGYALWHLFNPKLTTDIEISISRSYGKVFSLLSIIGFGLAIGLSFRREKQRT